MIQGDAGAAAADFSMSQMQESSSSPQQLGCLMEVSRYIETTNRYNKYPLVGLLGSFGLLRLLRNGKKLSFPREVSVSLDDKRA